MKFIEYPPEKIPQVIKLFARCGENDVLFVSDLHNIGIAILKELQNMGYSDDTQGMTICKTMAGTFRYLISADMGTWYSIQFKDDAGILHYIYSLENAIGQLSPDVLIEKGVKRDSDLETICYNSMMILKQLTLLTDGKPCMTLSSYAYKNWSSRVHLYDRNDLFPDANKIDCDLYGCDLDTYLRDAYKGGICLDYASNEVYYDGITLDVNSLYSWIMLSNKFPVGKPVFFTSKIPESILRRVKNDVCMYFVHISCKFEIKKNHIPFISIPNNFRYNGALSSSAIYTQSGVIDDDVELILTNKEYELFLKHYDVKNLQLLDGCAFRTISGIFNAYVNEFYTMKRKARERNDFILDRVSKMMLNSLSGNMAKKHIRQNIVLDDKFEMGNIIECASRAKSLIYIGACITSYARCMIVELAQANYKRFLYTDTDSLHLSGWDAPAKIEISPNKLGAMKIERKWIMAKFYKQKCYCEISDNLDVHLCYAGVPGEVARTVEKMLEGKPVNDDAKHFLADKRFKELNGFVTFNKYFDFEPIDNLKIENIPYLLEIPTGAFKTKFTTGFWNIDTTPDDVKRVKHQIKIKSMKLAGR